MITFLQAVNRVRLKLRETEVSTLTSSDAYINLLILLVNEAKEEVEAAWDWNYQRASYTITTAADDDTYSLTGAGSDTSIEVVINGSRNGLICGPFPNAYVDLERVTTVAGVSSDPGIYWDVVGIDSSGDLQLRITPTPSSVETYTVYARTRQAYLNASDLNTYIKAPWRPLVFLAYAKAVSERGEDGGNIYDETMREYEKALADAIQRDEKLGHRNTDWIPN